MAEQEVDQGTEQSQEVDEVLVGEGKVYLVKQDGKLFLMQGEVAVEVTSIVNSMNYQMGRLVLNIRENDYQNAQPESSSRDWLKQQLREPGAKLEQHQEDGFSGVTVGKED